MKHSIIFYICAMVSIISFLFFPITILLITHSTIPTAIAVLAFTMNILILGFSSYTACKLENK